MILYPAIDIRGGKAVRLLQGDYERETVYDAEPTDAASRWESEGARFLHVVDLDGAREGRLANLEAVRRISAAVEIPIQAGGGVRDPDSIDALIGAGAERVILGTAALRNPDLVEMALKAHGDRIVVSADVRGGRIAVQGWTERGRADAVGVVSRLAGRGVSRFVYTPIEVDGTMEGPDLQQLKAVALATDAELIYSGGVGDLSDLRSLACLAQGNLGGVIVGRALYEGRFSVADGQAALDPAGG